MNGMSGVRGEGALSGVGGPGADALAAQLRARGLPESADAHYRRRSAYLLRNFQVNFRKSIVIIETAHGPVKPSFPRCYVP